MNKKAEQWFRRRQDRRPEARFRALPDTPNVGLSWGPLSHGSAGGSPATPTRLGALGLEQSCFYYWPQMLLLQAVRRPLSSRTEKCSEALPGPLAQAPSPLPKKRLVKRIPCNRHIPRHRHSLYTIRGGPARSLAVPIVFGQPPARRVLRASARLLGAGPVADGLKQVSWTFTVTPGRRPQASFIAIHHILHRLLRARGLVGAIFLLFYIVFSLMDIYVLLKIDWAFVAIVDWLPDQVRDPVLVLTARRVAWAGPWLQELRGDAWRIYAYMLDTFGPTPAEVDAWNARQWDEFPAPDGWVLAPYPAEVDAWLSGQWGESPPWISGPWGELPPAAGWTSDSS